ncbi:MAG TPA: hypothetical protein VGM93_08750 [Acidimicrobiales bacterium]|jgi:hypothetical protein
MLMPAAILVVMVLGAISVDRAAVFNRQRELVAAAQAAANDAAGAGIDPGALRRGELAYDPARIDAAVRSALAARGLAASETTSVQAGRVVVELRMAVPWIFAKAVPGIGDTTEIHAVASAALDRR